MSSLGGPHALTAAFDALAPDLPLALVDACAQRTLRTLVARLPGVWGSFGFECRLAAASREVDLGAPVALAAGGRVLAGRVFDPLMERLVGADAAWRCLRDFAVRWESPASRLRDWVPFLFLEFDAASALLPISVPSVFVALDAPLRLDPEAPHVAAAREAAALLRGAPLPASLDGKLAECFEAVPRSGCVLHLGLMLGRGEDGLRLSVVLQAQEVCAYLERIGGGEAGAAVREVSDLVRDEFGRVQLDFDFDPAVRPRVGLGVRPDATRPGAWHGLVRSLVSQGCCEQEKGAALLAWPGECSRNGLRLRREISHVKLVCTPAGLFEAKAYFGATSQPPRPRGVEPH